MLMVATVMTILAIPALSFDSTPVALEEKTNPIKIAPSTKYPMVPLMMLVGTDMVVLNTTETTGTSRQTLEVNLVER